uniref:Uncharacterized protein n=1 Tax=Romanomermis culicivorax TaxID=13658 RepID=A0A915IVI6_ROMCU
MVCHGWLASLGRGTGICAAPYPLTSRGACGLAPHNVSHITLILVVNILIKLLKGLEETAQFARNWAAPYPLTFRGPCGCAQTSQGGVPVV